ncbi:TLR4 regulator and MIR-interacting MSAP [Popillia japonica]|uniref:TLR4 regulator and MIR-interacting MSAP n=1 Tax=Popillia japonica TaxID=7064 RepID=A0AAW1MU81_POPJA
MYKTVLVTVSMLLLILNSSVETGSSKDILRQAALPPCKACKTFTQSFKRGVDRTATGKFEGGDTAWEEEKLGSYARSEIRLVEIQEKICSDVEEGREQCYRLHEEYDTDIEDWWLHHQDEHPDIFQYLCIDKLKHCCPDLHYGPNCTPCLGYPDSVCSNNGKCKGSGTRKGNGKCACDKGYTGEICDGCAVNYYESYRDEKKILCSPCPISCDGPCTKSGCEKCASGWVKTDKGDCLDIDECAESTAACGPLQFCVNTEGNYKCLECDRSCAGCTGDGPDMCIKCAKGYTLMGNMCIDNAQEERKQYIQYTRILTYIGLCIATCITYQKNVVVAAIIGLAVAIYITVSEYVLNSAPQPNTTDLAEKLLLQNH